MKKLLGILVLSLVFYINPLVIEDSNAGWFSNPLEKCMDRVIENAGYNEIGAARVCKGAHKGTEKCMDRVIENTGYNEIGAARACTGEK